MITYRPGTARLLHDHTWRPTPGHTDGPCFSDGCGQPRRAHARGVRGWINPQRRWMPDPGERHPDWSLRASFSSGVRSKVHLFDGVRGACGRAPATSSWNNPRLTIHTPTTACTCAACDHHSHYPSPLSTSSGYPEAETVIAATLLVDYAHRTRDPHTADTALRLLSATPDIEPAALLIADPTPDPFHDALTHLNALPTGPVYLGQEPDLTYRIRLDRHPDAPDISLTAAQVPAFLIGLATAGRTLTRVVDQALAAVPFDRPVGNHLDDHLAPYQSVYATVSVDASKDPAP